MYHLGHIRLYHLISARLECSRSGSNLERSCVRNRQSQNYLTELRELRKATAIRTDHRQIEDLRRQPSMTDQSDQPNTHQRHWLLRDQPLPYFGVGIRPNACSLQRPALLSLADPSDISVFSVGRIGAIFETKRGELSIRPYLVVIQVVTDHGQTTCSLLVEAPEIRIESRYRGVVLLIIRRGIVELIVIVVWSELGRLGDLALSLVDHDLSFDHIDFRSGTTDVNGWTGMRFARAGTGRTSLTWEVRERAAIRSGGQSCVGTGAIDPGLIGERS